ncbi:hypothetical protein [Bradyrhizobium sp. USDA 4353]
MTWLATIVAVIAIAFFALIHPVFRRFLVGLFIATVATAIGIYIYVDYDSRQREKRQLQARMLITYSDVEFQDLVMSNRYGSWTIKGLVKNNSKYPIETIKLAIEVSNCDANKANCVVVGSDDSVTAYSINVPSGQARALDSYVTFNLPELKNWSWTYRVVYIEAKQ